MIKISKILQKKLDKRGFKISRLRHSGININSVFELPCNVSDVNLSVELKIGAYTYAGSNFKVYSKTEIGRFCSIGDDVKIGLFSHPLDRFSTSPYFYHKNFQDGWNKNSHEIQEYHYNMNSVKIGDDVWIGAGVMIKQGVTIGDGVIIGCGAVVTKDIPSYEIVAGIPAVKIGERKIKAKFANKYNGFDTMKGVDLRNMIRYSLRKKIKIFLINFFKNVS